MNIERCFEILEISPDSAYEDAKAAYRLLVQVWHPDKHAHNEKLHAKATSKMKEINAVWSDVEEYFKSGTTREFGFEETERQKSEERKRAGKYKQERQRREAAEETTREQQNHPKIITCPRCNTKNRVPDRKNSEAICGNCGHYLHDMNVLTFTDPQTGLMWTKSGNVAGNDMSWEEAMEWVKKLNHGGYRDWRLPSIQELKAFTQRRGDCPATWFNGNGFVNVKSCFYWSSSTSTSHSSFASGVFMNNGCAGDYPKGEGHYCHYVWPVRG